MEEKRDAQKLFVAQQRNVNTSRKTKYDIQRFQKYLDAMAVTTQIHKIKPRDLDTYIAGFLMEIQKPNGEHYEPHSILCIHALIHRHLDSLDYKLNIKSLVTLGKL